MILVAGATGSVGRMMVDQLLAQEARVRHVADFSGEADSEYHVIVEAGE